MRLFIAIDFPKAVNQHLAAVCKGIGNVKWVKPEQIHLTLRFIGEATEEQAGQIRLALARIKVPSFTIQLKGTGIFPPPEEGRRPRVLWVGIAPSAELFAIQKKVEEAVQASGCPEDKHAFNAHVTLARFQTPPGKDLDAWQQKHQDFETAPIEVDRFHLIRSRLTPKGAIHTIDRSFPLG